jgi:glycosyltransferase involved in cell wall biosynthesis
MSVSESDRSRALEQPLASIVVNNFNNERYLKDCLDALLAQTYRNIEIVVVDAFSSDGSRSLIDSYAELDSRVKKVYCESFVRYPAITYNLGFLNCTGKYIAINDPDDISMAERIEAQIAFLIANPSVDAVGCNCYEFNDEHSVLVETTVERNVRNAASPIRNPCLMFKRDLLATHGLLRWQSEYATDFEWLYRLYAGGVRFHMLQAPYVRFRKSHSTSISVSKFFNQGLKLALFRTYYGIRLFRQVGFRWWYATMKTYGHLFIKYPAKLLLRKFFRR